MPRIPMSAGGVDVLKRVPQNAISGHMYIKFNTNPVIQGRASTTGGTVSIPVLMRSPEPIPTTGQHYPLNTFPGSLPLLHESFPGKSRYGAGRSHTMFPLTNPRSEDTDMDGNEPSSTGCDNAPLRIKLPELELNLAQKYSSSSSTRSTYEMSNRSNYVDAYKSRLRQKGVDIKEVYSCDRARKKDTGETRLSIEKVCKTETEPVQRWKFGGKPRSEPSEAVTDQKQFTGRKVKVYKNKKISKNQANPNETSDNNTRNDNALGFRNDSFKKKGNQLEEEFEDFMEEFTQPQGMKQKTHNYGRKLGNIVSPMRMSQLLEVENPIRMENFYNHYM